ncbi:MAG: transporter [Desulfatirhabdiaceae bacterium]
MIRRLLVYAVLFCLCTTAAVSFAGGSGAYPNGAEDFMSGAAPPPGTYFLFYSNFYSADRYKDNEGNNYDAGPLADVDINVWANVFRFLHVTDIKILGGNYAFHTFVPFVNMDFEFGAPFDSFSDTRFGLGDIIVDPFILTWHTKQFHWVAGLDIFLPTGEYNEEKEPINPGNNVYTFEPVFAVTYLNGPWDVSVKFMYDISTDNDDYIITPGEAGAIGNPGLAGQTGSLTPGQEFHFDYAVGYNLSPEWTVGINGYVYEQITDDEIEGISVNDMKGSVIAVGPAIKYNYRNMSFILKSLWETEVENRPAGSSTWLKLVVAF